MMANTIRETVEEMGFAVLPDVLLRELCDDVIEHLGSTDLDRTRAGVRHAMRLPAVERIALRPELMGLARQVLGANAFPFRATIFDKSPDANWLVVWHQDAALPLRQKEETPGWGPWSVKDGVIYSHAPANVLAQVLALRIHLDDSTSDNGPLRVLPATHQLGILNDDQIQELAKRIGDVDCVVDKGGVVAMRPLILHASSKSKIDRPRRVLHIEYAASESIASPLQLAVA